mmetsp:Transcript_58847/g.140527  ORF Transcript_58847/g.140527 Transcript_58847/m.140527 type:complete len:388 (+) Transcript_58847:231-1394(+)
MPTHTTTMVRRRVYGATSQMGALGIALLVVAPVSIAFSPSPSIAPSSHLVANGRVSHATRHQRQRFSLFASASTPDAWVFNGATAAISSKTTWVPQLKNPVQHDAAEKKRARLEARGRMEREADHSAHLALSLYFQNHATASASLLDAERLHASRISRSCPAPSERRGFFMGDACTDDQCEVDLDQPAPNGSNNNSPAHHMSALFSSFSSRIGSSASAAERAAKDAVAHAKGVEAVGNHAGNAAHSAPAAAVKASWVDDVSHALGVLGVAHRMDHTVHEEKKFRDVVIEMPSSSSSEAARALGGATQGAQRRGAQRPCKGVVVQLLGKESLVVSSGEANAYVEAKRRTLLEGGWEVVRVSKGEWGGLHGKEIEFLAQKLAESGYWGS